MQGVEADPDPMQQDFINAIAAALEEERDTTIEACANVVESFARAISTDATVDCRTDMLYNSRISEIATKVRQRKGAR